VKLSRLLSPLLTLGLLGAGGWYVYDHYVAPEAAPVEYRTQPLARGRVSTTVTASGTLSPLKTVLVGSQVSGRIVELLADFNSQVKKGDVIARIDPSLLESDKERVQATLKSARASYTRAVADRDNARLIFERSEQLVKDGVIGVEELEATRTTYTSAKANVDSASAAVAVARAAIETADTNLLYTTIVSPIDGVVISRDVSVGQTVAASLSAPTVFTIAEDLKAMEVHTSVAESDIGQLRPEMKVSFTVDAYPNDRFRGKVSQIRNAATTLQNVVTYDAVVRVENDELKLRPGMTASATFTVEDRRDVLLVPNAALRFTPGDPALAALAPASKTGKSRKQDADADAPEAAPTRTVWQLVDGQPKPVQIQIGISDGTNTEVVAGELVEGAQIIIGSTGGPATPEPAKATSSPFNTGGGKKGGGR
jgi:HlyD family secretion protein